MCGSAPCRGYEHVLKQIEERTHLYFAPAPSLPYLSGSAYVLKIACSTSAVNVVARSFVCVFSSSLSSSALRSTNSISLGSSPSPSPSCASLFFWTCGYRRNIPENISVSLPRQYLRVASSAADNDSARLRFPGPAPAPAALIDCLRLRAPLGCGDMEALTFAVVAAPGRCLRTFPSRSLTSPSPESSSDSDDIVMMRRLLMPGVCCGE